MIRRALPLLLMLSCGHEPPPSDTAGIATSELSLQVLTETNPIETKVTIAIYALGRDPYARLALASGDRLIVRGLGAKTEAAVDPAWGLATYSAKVPVVDGDVAIDLVRSYDVSTTTVTLPPAFRLDVPSEPLIFDRPFTLTWSPAVPSAQAKLSLSGPCVSTAERLLASDSGRFVWSSGDYHPNLDAAPCTATLLVKRAGGSIAASPDLAGIQLFRAEQLRGVGVVAWP